MKSDAGYVTRMTVEGKDGIRIGGLDIIELDRMVASGSEEALIWRDAEAVNLRIWVWDGPGTYSRQGFPEASGLSSVRTEVKAALDSVVPDGMVVASCDCVLAAGCKHSVG